MDKRRTLYTVLAVVFIAITAFLFFAPDDFEGNVLQQHDIQQGIANGQEVKAYTEATGNDSRWTNALFGGMPNFQIAPSYPANSAISWIWSIYSLGLPSPANLLFAMMFGFFIMCLCMKFKWHEALFASIAWGFSTYFIIIIGAGHIWKFITLSYIPPTIGGIYLIYNGRRLAGSALAAIFGALQLQSNHPQMTYYFLFVILAMMLAWLYQAIKSKTASKWLISTACLIGVGILAVAANSASLYNTYEYSKETVRGRASDLSAPKGEATGGMNRDAITQWSYGIDETLSLLIPNIKGGATIKPVAGESQLLSVMDTEKADELNLQPQERQFLAQFSQYFGNQPMTNGPVYVGAFVLVLALIAIFTIKSPMKWALLGVMILAILLSWGRNFQWFTDIFIDYLPMYNKFRAVSSILVVVEFAIPLLAVMAIRNIISDPDYVKKNLRSIYIISGAASAICLIGAVSPGIFGSPLNSQEFEMFQQAGAFSNPLYAQVIDAIRQTRLSLVSADCIRSFIFIIIGTGLILLRHKGKLDNNALFVCLIAALTLIDLFTVNKRYVNSDNFTRPALMEETFKLTQADKMILKDKSNYRVFDIQGLYSARSSYFHKTIGGYHAAKLTRYNDLLERQISKGNKHVLNMLNAKYFLDGDRFERNDSALGNAWIANRLEYVENADKEMSALDTLNTATGAVADARFKTTLGEAIPKSAGDTIFETSYAPNELHYRAKSAKGGVAVFSEVYFPWGWHAEIDGKPVEIGRVNYILRALRLPAGEHEIIFRFDPESLHVTNAISLTAVGLIYLLIILSAFVAFRHIKRNRKLES